jgi:hypothetical protein
MTMPEYQVWHTNDKDRTERLGAPARVSASDAEAAAKLFQNRWDKAGNFIEQMSGVAVAQIGRARVRYFDIFRKMEPSYIAQEWALTDEEKRLRDLRELREAVAEVVGYAMEYKETLDKGEGTWDAIDLRHLINHVLSIEAGLYAEEGSDDGQ